MRKLFYNAYRNYFVAICSSCCALSPSIAVAADNTNDIAYLRQSSFRMATPFVGQSNLFTMKSDGEDQQGIIADTDRFQVSWSPDGSRVAYAANRDIYTADPDGTNIQRLTTDGGTMSNSEPDWSGNGTKIAFTRQCGAGRERCIFTMNANDGSSVTKITQSDPAFIGTDAGPDWSPGMSKIIYSKVARGGLPGKDEDIYVVDMATKDEKIIISDPYSDVAPAWSPSGEQIAFESNRPTNEFAPPNGNVWKTLPDGSGLTLLTGGQLGYDGQPAWSPDERHIAFVSDRLGEGKTYLANNYADIFTMTSAGKNPVQLTKSSDLEVAPDWRYRKQVDPRFRILVERGKPGSRDIFAVRSGEKGPDIQLTTDPADDFSAAWSPDRSRVAFISTRDGKQQLYLMNADGTSQKRIGDEKLGSYNTPAWSADGKEIIVSVEVGKQSDLYGIQLDGTKRQITSTTYNEKCPDASPDGQKIAFQSDKPSYQEDIYTINFADGTGETRLTTTPWGPFSRGSGQCARYSFDGSRIAFQRKFARISDVATVRAIDGKDLRVLSPKFGASGQRRPLWAPTTDYLAFTDGGDFGETGPGNIFVTKPDGTDGKFVTDGLATSWR